MSHFGEKIRALREEKNLPLRKVGAAVDIDQATVSKWEKGTMRPKKEIVLKLAEFFEINKEELLGSWVADKVVYEMGDDKNALQTLQAAEKEIKYLAKKNNRNLI